MSASNFLACFNETESYEGMYVDNLHDPGGATMAGVTQATYDHWLQMNGHASAPVKGISLADREAIYRDFYWKAVDGDNLYAGLDLVVVDTGWGSGPAKAIELLQQALGVTADGKLGQRTLDALKVQENSTDLINEVCKRRMAYFKGLSTWRFFGGGWTVRLNGIQGKALVMNAAALRGVTAAPAVTASPAPALIADPVAPPQAVAAVQAKVAQLTTSPEHLTAWEKIKAIFVEIGL